MRNLKKVLSMTLALVMMLGMMTFAGAAEATKKVTPADLTDMKDVVNKEQVALLVDLGIINGIKQADGTFKYAPTEGINRASYAKMVYAVMMASDNADVYKGVATGLKDVKGHWAEGFIGYCVSTKIAAGNGNGAFMPDDNITVVAGAKMMLTALGYDAKASGYENDALWSINIMRDAQAAGLLDSVAQAAGDAMTRDTAARMIYNALFAKTVTPKFAYDMGVKYLDEYKEGEVLGLGNYKLAMKTGVLIDNEQRAGASNLDGKSKIYTLSGDTEIYKIDSTMLDLGKTVSFAVQLKSTTRTAGALDLRESNIAKIYSTNVTPSSDNKVVVVDAGMDATDAVKWLNKNNLIASGAVGTMVALSGSNPTSTTGQSFTSATFESLANNVKAYVIDNNGDKVIDYFVTSTKTFTKVTDDPTTKLNADGKMTVRVPGVVASYTLASNVVGYEGLKKNDQVLVLKSADGWVIEKAASFVGQLTATKAGKAIIDTKTYAMSGAVALTVVTNEGYNKDVTYWLDECGNIVLAKAVTAAVESKYAYSTTGIEKVGSAITGYTYRLKLLFIDGTVEIVPVTMVGGKTIVETVTDATTEVDFDDVDAENTNKFFTYDVDKKDNYELTLVPGETTTDTNGDGVITSVTNGITAITSGKASFATGASLIGNSKTVFIEGKANSTTKTYVGIANVPGYATVTNSAFAQQALTVDGIAKFVYVTGTPAEATNTKTYVYVTSTDYTAFPKTDAAAAYNEYSAIVDGAATTLKTKTGFTFAAKGFYDITTADGLVSAATHKTTKQGVKFLDGVVRAGGSYYTYDADSLVYVIDDGAVTKIDVKDISTDADDQVLFVKKNDIDTTVIGTLFIVKGEFAAQSTSMTLAGGTSAAATVTTTTDVLAGTAAVTSWTATNKNIKITAADMTGADTVTTLKINGVDYTSGTNYALTTTTAHTLKLDVKNVTTIDGVAYTTTYTYFIAVPAVTAP